VLTTSGPTEFARTTGQFNSEPGNREFRGGIDTKGQFALNDKWVWGWDAVAVSDKSFFFDYGLGPYKMRSTHSC
jgi:LPS-assembly protein